MSYLKLESSAAHNVLSFSLFRMFFSARFYYPVYTLLFLDFGLTLEQFGILNGIWAVTIVLCEVPSGALADTIGRRTLLVAAGILMFFEMLILLFAPIGGGAQLFTLFIFNRVFSGMAEAAASGADEALAFDALQVAGQQKLWGQVLARVQRDTSLAFFFALTIGAAVYDPRMVNAVLKLFGYSGFLTQQQLIKLPIALTMVSSLVVLWAAFRMREPSRTKLGSVRFTLSASLRKTIDAGHWVWATPFAFAILLAVMVTDNSIRQFLTLASEYWNVIDLPIATYGLIGAGMSLIGIVIPRAALCMTEKQSVQRNFFISCLLIFVGFSGLSLVIPYWGILPAMCLFTAMHLMNFFSSHYLNNIAPSEHRATILSFKGLSTNIAYAMVSLLYSGLIVALKSSHSTSLSTYDEDAVFIESLHWFSPYFAVTLLMALFIYFLRFTRLSIFQK